VLDPDVGDNQLVERLPFDHVTYDHKDDVLVVAVGGKDQRYPVVLRHLVHHPRELLVDQKLSGRRAQAHRRVRDDHPGQRAPAARRRSGVVSAGLPMEDPA
jgi:hypothetical protein